MRPRGGGGGEDEGPLGEKRVQSREAWCVYERCQLHSFALSREL